MRDFSQQSLEAFRTVIREEFFQKGVQPPPSGTDEEKTLYETWMKGLSKIRSYDRSG